MTTNDIISYTNPYSRRAKKRRNKTLGKIKHYRSTSSFFQDYRKCTYTLQEFNAHPLALVNAKIEDFKCHNGRKQHARIFGFDVLVDDDTEGFAPVFTHLRHCTWDGYERYVEVEWIRAFPAGQGLGGMAMNELCHLADKHMQPLTLQAYPLGEDKSDDAFIRLRRFYSKFGFRPWDLKNNVMVRHPAP